MLNVFVRAPCRYSLRKSCDRPIMYGNRLNAPDGVITRYQHKSVLCSAKPPLNLGHGRKITPHKKWARLLAHTCAMISLNSLRARKNDRRFADDVFKCIFLNENVWIPIKISLKFVPKGTINNIPALVQIMAWRRSGDKPLSEPMLVSFPTHICVTRPQWVNLC